MNAKPTLARPRAITVTVAAFASALIGIGILSLVTELFQSRGVPMAELTAAEHACVGHIYVSDRETCMREWVAASRGDHMARR